jgi:ATP-dependent DNA helicase RecG
MASKKLINSIAQGEGYFTEFKRSVNSDLKKELVAFANASGGNIFLGIEDNGTICGIQHDNMMVSKIQEFASECDPPVEIQIKTLTDNVLQIIVPESKTKPHRTTTGFYLRTGANSQKMRTDSILEFLEKEGRVRFDERIRKDVDFPKYFSTNQWNRFLRLSGISPDVERDAVLQSLGAVKIQNNKPLFTNAGLLIFTDSPSAFLHQAYISCVAFRTSEKVDIIDRKDFQGDFFTNIESVLSFIERHINVAAKIENTIREDVWEVPKVALREAFVNAVVHRDYLETGARVVVEVFPDKIVVSNPGGLPKGMPAKDFGKYSLARNAILANIMQRAGFNEKLGTGITRIKQEIEKAELPEPVFHYNNFFAVEFTRIEKVEKSSLTEGLNEGLNEGLKSLLSIIIENPGIQAKRISEILNRPIKTLERQIKILSEKSLIEHKGSKKTGGYWTSKNFNKS